MKSYSVLALLSLMMPKLPRSFNRTRSTAPRTPINTSREQARRLRQRAGPGL